MSIGKIVKSDSHISYVCQIHGPREVETQPMPADYAFGRFVLIAIRTEQDDNDQNGWIWPWARTTPPEPTPLV